MNDDRLPWFRAFPLEWLDALSGLGQDEQCVYNVVLLRIYQNDGPIGDDARAIGNRCKISERRAAAALDRLMQSGKLFLEEGKIFNERCRRELRRRSTAADTARHNGKKNGEKSQGKQRKRRPVGSAMGSHRATDKDLDIDSSKKEKKDDGSLRSPARATGTFNEFWLKYPHKVGKAAAEKSFKRALQKGAEPEAIMSGLDRYVRTKPVETPWCNPATFLNQERWTDEPSYSHAAPGAPAARASSAGNLVRGFAAAAARRAVGEPPQALDPEEPPPHESYPRDR